MESYHHFYVTEWELMRAADVHRMYGTPFRLAELGELEGSNYRRTVRLRDVDPVPNVVGMAASEKHRIERRHVAGRDVSKGIPGQERVDDEVAAGAR